MLGNHSQFHHAVRSQLRIYHLQVDGATYGSAQRSPLPSTVSGKLRVPSQAWYANLTFHDAIVLGRRIEFVFRDLGAGGSRWHNQRTDHFEKPCNSDLHHTILLQLLKCILYWESDWEREQKGDSKVLSSERLPRRRNGGSFGPGPLHGPDAHLSPLHEVGDDDCLAQARLALCYHLRFL